ncbi:hypothetical protein Mal15_59800 [Stieleria maiorica]|uniref:DUF1559 domain-containing protein n=1 Tax=Stieleria maiorica TaxID=2795974 RepID=A0A5B9MKW0_9BACT|nr:DUF1559 domain-containing protein [Stieleria maiorica]QEG01899.1 hypothetical protein Mal15_59800 [Stieleria maiorica]
MVISVITILIGLLLPAVQAAREASRRLYCSNQLKQVGIAMQTYHITYRMFPINSNFGTPLGEDGRTRSWNQCLLSFLELASVEGLIKSEHPLADNRAAAETAVPAYLCPSGHSSVNAFNRADISPDWHCGVTTYKSCAGSNWDWGRFAREEPTGRFAGQRDGMAKGNGFLSAGRGKLVTTRTRDIRDGLSNTYCVGETLPDLTRWSWWYHSNSAAATCAIPLNFGIDLKDEDAWQENNGFMSRHPGGAHFLLCDGSVRFDSSSIAADVYYASATIDSHDGK